MNICPVFHVDVIYVLRQRMLIKPPVNSGHPACECVVLIKLIALKQVANSSHDFLRHRDENALVI
jgi:hypothetical protein